MEFISETSPSSVASPLTVTEEDIEEFLNFKTSVGVKSTAIAKYRGNLKNLYNWLPEDKIITRERLLEWREGLEETGYSKLTIEKYVTYVNLYTKHRGHPELNIKNTRAYDLRGKQFGYLTAIEPTGEKKHKDIIWRCKCKCGKETEVPAGLLVRCNTTSCGCLTADIFNYHNRYVEGTELRQSLTDNPKSTRAASGYTGVTKDKGKWLAYITYKRKYYKIGYFSKLEDAVKARARAKEEVMADAARLYEATDHLYTVKPGRPPRSQAPKEEKGKREPAYPTRRNDNTTGHTGVKHEGVRWKAEISYNGVRYHLGLYGDFEQAVKVRKTAEALALAEDVKGIEAMSISFTTYRLKKNTHIENKE